MHVCLGPQSGSPIVVSVPLSTAPEPIADLLAALYPTARVSVVARQQREPALGDTGQHDRSAIVAVLTDVLGTQPAGATLADITRARSADPVDATTPEVLRACERLGVRPDIALAPDCVALTRDQALELLSESAPDELLRTVVAGLL